MNRLKFLSLGLIVSFACLQPIPTLAQDQDQGKIEASKAKGLDEGDKKPSETTKRVAQKGDESRSVKSDKTGMGAGDFRSKDSRPQNTSAVQQTKQSRSHGTQFAQVSVQGNRDNHYNGQWIAADTHSDWDQNSVHRWNNHNYRWYDGGWLIIDDSGTPDVTGPLVVQVKQRLAQAGYYNGHFTETVGPRTRQAISNYQSANGLPVSGEIDGPLLQSLNLE